ncbi:MAG: ABC transporter ATP-binding protein [Clostridia bacterium]|jgi:cobalt/nickel transport system ATP-binding protein|nr:ABC transporter ATP-binding protein [Clostridia bacterium]
MSHHKLEARNLSYAYPDGQEALKNLSFTVTHGEAVGLIGANGAGKSTVLALLMGLLFPSEGQALLADVAITKKTLPLVRQSLGLVMQNPDDQLFMTSVYDDVAFGPRNYQLTESEVAARVAGALDLVGIPHLRDRAPYRLSVGEKRCAAIAAVLSMQPDILLMDEPTAGLDPQARRRIMNLLNSFSHTKIITSHDLDMVWTVCRRVILLKGGTVAADGPAEEILTDARLLESCGLELPLSLQNCPSGQAR